MTTPQNCADCGTRAQPGQSFCDACGSVLSWTDGAARSTTTGSPSDAGGSAAGAGSYGAPANTATADSSGAARNPGTAGSSGASDSAPPRSTSSASGAASAGAPGATGSAPPASTTHAARSTATGRSSAAPGSEAGGASTTPPPSGPAATAAPGDANPGWNAFTRPDGGTGLPLTTREHVGTGSAPHAATATRTPAAPATDTAPEEAAAGARDAQRPEPGTTPSHPVGHHDTPAGDPSRPPATAPPAPDGTAPTRPVPPASQDPDPSTTQGIHTRARRLLVPVTDAEPRPAAEPSVAPVLPGRPTPQRPDSVRAPGEEHGVDGGTPCPWCATRNRPERHFCARCAMPMAGDGPAPARLPWWRRLGPFGSRETPWAGDRPRLRRTFDRVLSWLGIALVLALLIALAVNIPQGIQATRDHFAKRAPVSPDRYSASRSYPGHKPELAFDKINDSWWGPGVSETGRGQYIEARFDQPTRLLDLVITPGTSTRADELAKSALPHRLTATITGKDGRTTTRSLTLDQGAGPQRRAFRVGEVTAVRFTIDSAYGTSAKKQVAIAEIEFFGPSSANGT
ncbi:zinc ribbon domain-containing protein [Streptomyces sp. NPDC126510]|uniref:NADase-type glycan-binding domain-containing protein n=1 Tax=Streptomyces sp. NPDC126510 TaxID=3155317 RepID=UPI00332EBDD2